MNWHSGWSFGVRTSVGLAAALALAWSATLAQAPQGGAGTQQPPAGPPGFVLRSQTNVVLVDVRVWDKQGKPVTDLKKEDFRVYEDGARQTITSFSLENIERLQQATAEGGPPLILDLAKLPPAQAPQALQDHRLLIMFFDLSSLAPEDLLRAVKAATDFARTRMTPADLVAIVTYTSSLRVVQNFTNDRDALDKSLKTIRMGEEASALGAAGTQGEAGTINAAGEEVVAQDVSAAFTPDETEFNIFNTDQKLAAIESLARMLRDVPGRKSVVHFSSGVERTGVENQAQLRATIDAANQANVSLYTVDARGLMALPAGGDASSASPAGTAVYTGQAVFSQLSSLHGSRETLASLAADTGGKSFYDLNDFSQAFREVQAENSSYYLLGYSPTNLRSDGRFRRLRVEVDRPGLRIASRPGYFAPKDFRQFTREDKELQLQRALEFDQPFLDLPFVVEAAYFLQANKNYNVVLAAKIPASAVSFLRKSATHQTEFDFIWRVTDPKGSVAGVLRDTLPVKVSEETYQRVLSGNVLYEGGMVLSPGNYRLKVVVRENQTGKMGTFEQPVTLPPVPDSGLALSSIVLSNEVQAGASGRSRKPRGIQEDPLQVGAQSVLPSVTRVFRTNQNLYVLLESYRGKLGENAGSAPGPPAVALAFLRGGAKVAEAGPFRGKMEKAGTGRASYFVQLPLAKFPVGRYIVQVNVLDPAAERVAFARVPMAVVKATPTVPAGGGAR
jgi:VWFA-related protein